MPQEKKEQEVSLLTSGVIVDEEGSTSGTLDTQAHQVGADAKNQKQMEEGGRG
jgi:hypothetical protein